MLEMVRAHSLELVVAKRVTSTYEQGRRTGSWVKIRVELAQELVIGGYTPGTNSVDAVVIGFYRGDALHFCGGVRAEFVPASRRQVHAKLQPIETERCPFVNLPEPSTGRWGQGLTAARYSFTTLPFRLKAINRCKCTTRRIEIMRHPPTFRSSSAEVVKLDNLSNFDTSKY